MKQPELTNEISPGAPSMSKLFQAGLRKVRQKLNHHASLSEILDTLIETIEEQHPDMIGSILLLEGSKLFHGSAAGLPEDYCQAINGLVIGFGVGSCGTAAFTGEQVIVENIETHPYWEKFKDYGLKAGVKACWSQPIFSSEGKVLGTFALYYRDPKAPEPIEIELLEAAAEIAGIAIEMKMDEAVISHNEAQLEALKAASLAIAAAPDLDAALREITERARTIIGAHQSVTSLTRGSDWSQAINAVSLSEKYAQWQDYSEMPDGSGIYAYVCKTNQPMRMTQEELESHPMWKGFGKHAKDHPPMRGWLAVPLIAKNGENLGLLQLSDKYEGEFTEADAAILTQLAQFASTAIEKAQAEQALKESEERFRIMADAAPHFIWELKPDGVPNYVNKAALTYVGKTLDEFIQTPWVAYLPEEDAERVSNTILKAVAARSSYRIEHRIRRADGEYRWFISSGDPSFLPSGELYRYIGSAIDIQDMKETEQELEWSNKLMAMVAHAQNLFFSNENIYDMFERPLQDLIDLTESDYGFIGEILYSEDGQPYLKCNFLTNIGWNEETKNLWEQNRKTGFEFHKIDNLFGQVITTGAVVIANDPVHDPRRSKEGLPKGHPPLNAFLGVPFYKGDKLLGMMGLANRPGGYDTELVEKLKPFLDACGNIIAAYRNQKEKEQLTEVLAESEARFRHLADAAPMGIFMAEENAQITYLNKYWLDYTGKSFEESLGLGWSELIWPDDYPKVVESFQRSFEARSYYEIETRIKGKDGQYRWFYAKGGPRHLPNGEFAGFIGTFMDIHSRKLAEEALKENERRFRAITESMPQIVWAATPDGKRDYYNQRWSDFTGADLEASKGDGWRRLCHPDDEALVVETWYHSVESGEPYEMEYRLRAGDGQYHYFLGRAVPIRDENGNIIRWFGTSTDISDIVQAREMMSHHQEELEKMVFQRTKELEAAYDRIKQEMEERSKAEDALRQSQKMEAVGQLTGGLAHDFNNLLTVIAGNTEMAQMKAEGDAKLSKYLSQVAGAAERGKKLTEQLLAFSRRQKLDPATINLNKVISDLSDMVSKTLGANIIFETKLSPALWNTHIDQTQLELAVINILVNARDAMKDGGTVMITTRNVELNAHDATAYHNLEEGRYVCLSITDDGCGMAPDILARVTEPFFTTKDVGKGTGLGLSQVYGFVRQSNGQLNIYSEPGMGTTIRMYFPAIMGSVQTQQTENQQQVDQPEALATILVVEDNNEVRELACNVLQDQGYRVLCAENAETALDWIQGGEPIDLMFSDVAMPGGMNGVSLAIEVRKQRPNVKILLTTGFANDVIRPKERMQFKVLQKPYRPSDLLHWVKNLLEE